MVVESSRTNSPPSHDLRAVLRGMLLLPTLATTKAVAFGTGDRPSSSGEEADPSQQ